MQPWAILGRANSAKQEKAAQEGGSEIINNTDIVFGVLHAATKRDEVIFVVSLDDFSTKVAFSDGHRNFRNSS